MPKNPNSRGPLSRCPLCEQMEHTVTGRFFGPQFVKHNRDDTGELCKVNAKHIPEIRELDVSLSPFAM